MPPTCRLIAPAYPLADEETIRTCLARAADWAARLGWRLQTGHLVTRCAVRGARLPAADRAADLRQGDGCMLLWALRGGYGCSELVEELRHWRPRHPPRLLGYSDCTILHGYWQRRGWPPGIYGPMPAAPADATALASLRAVCTGAGQRFHRGNLTGVRALRAGSADAPLFAACLRVLASSVGTVALPRLAGHILAVEDIDEAPYALHRDLQQLYASGALHGLRGLVFGTMPWRPDAPYAGPDADAVAAEWAGRLQVPCVAGLPFGHVADPLSLPQEVPTRLTVREDGGWSLELAGLAASTRGGTAGPDDLPMAAPA
ncbi:MAG: LD-carboxypeptidase [Planctomycetota bacterium]